MLNLKIPSSVSSINFSGTLLRSAGMLALFAIATSVIWLVKANAQNASSGQTQTAQEVLTLELSPITPPFWIYQGGPYQRIESFASILKYIGHHQKWGGSIYFHKPLSIKMG